MGHDTDTSVTYAKVGAGGGNLYPGNKGLKSLPYHVNSNGYGQTGSSKPEYRNWGILAYTFRDICCSK